MDPDDDGGVYIFAPDDVRTRFLGDLGLKLPASIEKLFKGQFYAQISAERLDMLDNADIIVQVATRKPQTEKLTASRTYRRLRAVREDRLVRIDDPDLAIAMSYSSVLSTRSSCARWSRGCARRSRRDGARARRAGGGAGDPRGAGARRCC